jgi:hypothetical protein
MYIFIVIFHCTCSSDVFHMFHDKTSVFVRRVNQWIKHRCRKGHWHLRRGTLSSRDSDETESTERGYLRLLRDELVFHVQSVVQKLQHKQATTGGLVGAAPPIIQGPYDNWDCMMEPVRK